MPRGGAKPGAGRPPKHPDELRDHVVKVRMSSREVAMLECLAVERRETAAEVLRAGLVALAAR